jgi:hypothetical protein
MEKAGKGLRWPVPMGACKCHLTGQYWPWHRCRRPKRRKRNWLCRRFVIIIRWSLDDDHDRQRYRLPCHPGRLLPCHDLIILPPVPAQEAHPDNRGTLRNRPMKGLPGLSVALGEAGCLGRLSAGKRSGTNGAPLAPPERLRPRLRRARCSGPNRELTNCWPVTNRAFDTGFELPRDAFECSLQPV